MSTTPTAPPSSTPTDDRDRAHDDVRFADRVLKSVPIPEGVDPNARATVGEAFESIKAEDFLKVHQAPCSREGLLTGIGSGGAIGAVRYICGAAVPKSANWAVASGVAVSVIAYEYCQYQRRVERMNLKRVVEVVSKKQLETKKQEEEKQRQLKLEQEEAARKAAQKSWYKFW